MSTTASTIKNNSKGIMRIAIPTGTTAYLIAPGDQLPDDLQKIVEARARVIAEDKIFELRQQEQANLKSIAARIPTHDEIAGDVLKMLTPHSELEQNQVFARVLVRLKKIRKQRLDEHQQTFNSARDILQELQQADNELDGITLGNFTIIE